MICNSMSDFFSRFILLSFLNVCVAILFIITTLLLIKIKRFDYHSAIRTKQLFFNVIVTVYIFGTFALTIGFVIWVILFFMFRYAIFKKDRFILNNLYENYEKNDLPYPLIMSLKSINKDINQVIQTSKIKQNTLSEFNYNFINHIYSSIVPIIFCVSGINHICETSPLFYAVEYFSLTICISVIVGKILYKAFLNSRQSLTYLCPNLSYIPVIVCEIIYYFIAIIVFRTTS